jgi:hypothetical protein
MSDDAIVMNDVLEIIQSQELVMYCNLLIRCLEEKQKSRIWCTEFSLIKTLESSEYNTEAPTVLR